MNESFASIDDNQCTFFFVVVAHRLTRQVFAPQFRLFFF